MPYTILGGGSVVAAYYLPAFQKLGMIDQVTVVEQDDGLFGEWRAQYPGLTCVKEGYASFLQKLAPSPDSQSDAVIVALPNQFHVDASRIALEKGRHVLCEKPLSLKSAECGELNALARKHGRHLKVGMSRRYLPAMLLARQIVEGGELGAVRSIEVCDRAPFLWRPRSFTFFARESGGILADMGVHYLDFIGMLVGPITPLSYTDDSMGGTEASLRYELAAGDVKISLRLSRVEEAECFLKIVCERGEVRVDKQNEVDVTVVREGSARKVSLQKPFDDASWPKNFSGGFCQMLADFKRELAGEKTPIANAVDAERTIALIEWAYERRPQPAQPRVSGGGRDKIAVTGGSGFIGGHLVERLTAEGHDVRVAVRSPASCVNLARYNVTMMPTDLQDMKDVRALVDGARIVYHLAYGKNTGTGASITVDGTKNVVQAAIDAKVECVVVLSTAYVFGFPATDRPVDESFPYRPYGGEYAETKTVMEKWCLEQARRSGTTRIVVLNPTSVYGPGGGTYTKLPVDLARMGTFCWVSDGSGFCNYNYVEGLVDAICLAAKVPEAHGNRFIINDGTTTWREFIDPLVRSIAPNAPSFTPAELDNLPRYGERFRVIDLVRAVLAAPSIRRVAKRSPLIRKAFKLSKNVAPTTVDTWGAADLSGPDVVDPASLFPPEWVGGLFTPDRVTFSAKKAKDILKWEPRVGLAEAQARSVEWLVRTGQLPEPS